MDPEELTELGRRFWYAWAASLIGGTGLVFLGVWILDPGPTPWLVAIQGLLAILFAGFAAVGFALGNRLNAAGQTLSAVGFVVLAAAAVRGLTWTSLSVGFGFVLVGSAVGFWADFGDRVPGLASD